MPETKPQSGRMTMLCPTECAGIHLSEYTEAGLNRPVPAPRSRAREAGEFV